MPAALAAVGTADELALDVAAPLPQLGQEPLPQRCRLGGGLIVELEPFQKAAPKERTAPLEGAALAPHATAAVQRFTATARSWQKRATRGCRA